MSLLLIITIVLNAVESLPSEKRFHRLSNHSDITNRQKQVVHFDCQDVVCSYSKLFKKDKVTIISKMNEFRNRIAGGNFKTYPYCVNNVNKLIWSEAIADVAQKDVNKCHPVREYNSNDVVKMLPQDGDKLPPFTRDYDAQYETVKVGKQTCDIVRVIEKMPIRKISNYTYRRSKYSAFDLITRGQMEDFSRKLDSTGNWKIIFNRAESTKVGCGYMLRRVDYKNKTEHLLSYLTCIYCSFNHEMPAISQAPCKGCGVKSFMNSKQKWKKYQNTHEKLCIDQRNANEYADISDDIDEDVTCITRVPIGLDQKGNFEENTLNDHKGIKEENQLGIYEVNTTTLEESQIGEKINKIEQITSVSKATAESAAKLSIKEDSKERRQQPSKFKRTTVQPDEYTSSDIIKESNILLEDIGMKYAYTAAPLFANESCPTQSACPTVTCIKTETCQTAPKCSVITCPQSTIATCQTYTPCQTVTCITTRTTITTTTTRTTTTKQTTPCPTFTTCQTVTCATTKSSTCSTFTPCPTVTCSITKSSTCSTFTPCPTVTCSITKSSTCSTFTPCPTVTCSITKSSTCATFTPCQTLTCSITKSSTCATFTPCKTVTCATTKSTTCATFTPCPTVTCATTKSTTCATFTPCQTVTCATTRLTTCSTFTPCPTVTCPTTRRATCPTYTPCPTITCPSTRRVTCPIITCPTITCPTYKRITCPSVTCPTCPTFRSVTCPTFTTCQTVTCASTIRYTTRTTFRRTTRTTIKQTTQPTLKHTTRTTFTSRSTMSRGTTLSWTTCPTNTPCPSSVTCPSTSKPSTRPTFTPRSTISKATTSSVQTTCPVSTGCPTITCDQTTRTCPTQARCPTVVCDAGRVHSKCPTQPSCSTIVCPRNDIDQNSAAPIVNDDSTVSNRYVKTSKKIIVRSKTHDGELKNKNTNLIRNLDKIPNTLGELISISPPEPLSMLVSSDNVTSVALEADRLSERNPNRQPIMKQPAKYNCSCVPPKCTYMLCVSDDEKSKNDDAYENNVDAQVVANRLDLT